MLSRCTYLSCEFCYTASNCYRRVCQDLLSYDCQELDALAAQLVRLGAEVPAAAANSQSAGAATAAAAGQSQPPLAESDSDSEDQLPIAPDGSLLVSEPPQPLYVVVLLYFLISLCLLSTQAYLLTAVILLVLYCCV